MFLRSLRKAFHFFFREKRILNFVFHYVPILPNGTCDDPVPLETFPCFTVSSNRTCINPVQRLLLFRSTRNGRILPDTPCY